MAALLVAVGLGVPLTLPSPAYAYNCGTATSATYHNAYDTTANTTGITNFWGVKGTLDIQSVKFCAGDTSINFSNAYIMLLSDRESTNVGWGAVRI